MLVKTKHKRINKTKRQRLNNINKKTTLRILIKKTKSAVLIGNLKEAQRLYYIVQSIIDRQTNKGLIHKNKAARCKARLTKKICLKRNE